MSTDLVENYKRLISKQQQLGDKYVIVDKKWFEHWKRFVGLEKSDEENPVAPGPIDFTKLAKQETISANPSKEVQLRDDAVEGNDFTFIPYDLYKELKDKYTITGREIIRNVVPQGEFDTTIEMFLVPLRICESKSNRNKVKQIYRSRRTLVDDIRNEICNEFRVAQNSTSRLLAVADENSTDWEVLDYKPGAFLDEIDLTRNAIITYDSKGSSPRLSGFSNFFRSTSASYTPGLCGLSNLGNTCFMNSALQCLSNVLPLTQYFLQDEYQQHINRENPLGMKGDVAEAYGRLIHDMWSGRSSSCAPKSLKHSVARYAPQFSGYAQQDSQEFMSFLLDGLHEDLNRVKQKPYMNKQDDDGTKSDAALAEEQWDYYKKRNESKIQEIFHGQIKSVVQCLTCKTKGRTFDPICFLSLPLPGKAKMRTFKIDYARLNGRIKTYSIRLNEHQRMSDLVQAFCEAFRPKSKANPKSSPMEIESQDKTSNEADEADEATEEQDDDDEIDDDQEDFTLDPDYDGHEPKTDHMLMAEVYNHRIHLQYSDNSSLMNIMEHDHMVFYETSQSLKVTNNDTILMPCIFREENGRSNFGLPIYLTIPRRNCTGKHIQDALDAIIGNFLPVSNKDGSLDKTLYAASCQLSRNYHQQVRKLESMLNENIEFNQYNASLVCEVVSSIVEKYKQQSDEEKKRTEKDQTSSSSTAIDRALQAQQQVKTTLFDCFRLFTTKERLSSEDLWMCRNCKKLQRASKKIDIWLLPKILIVQLKRFKYNRFFREKIDQLIDCPLRDLDLSQFVLNPNEKPKAKYDLIAVSNHMGGLGGGHYTAYGKNANDKKWHSFDDSYVGDAHEENIITKAAYVLIYQQREPASE